MTVQELYDEAEKGSHMGLKLLIDYLVYEKKALELTDNHEKLTYYLQDRFRSKMNEYIHKYKKA